MDIEKLKPSSENEVDPQRIGQPEVIRIEASNKALMEWLCAVLASPAAQRRQKAMESEGLYGRPENDDFFE